MVWPQEDDLAYKTPTQIERRRRDKCSRDSLSREGNDKKKSRLSFLDNVKELNSREAEVMSRVVMTNNQEERPMYFSHVFEQVKAYSCNICVTILYGKNSLLHHHASKHHYNMMMLPCHPHENFSRDQIINISTRMLSQSACFIKELLDNLKNEMVIGVEYMLEVIELNRAVYHCLLCDVETESVDTIMSHMSGFHHCMLYMLLFFPKVYKKLVLLKKDRRKTELATVCERIAKHYKDTVLKPKPFQHKGKLSLKEKRTIRCCIDNGLHLSDKTESFGDGIFFNDDQWDKRLKHNVFTEFLISEEDSHDDLYKRRKGETWCRLCLKTLSDDLLEKIVHPYTGKHLAHTLRGVQAYDNIPTTELEPAMDTVREPLIGTEYMVEYIVDDTQQVNFKCLLCSKPMNNTQMVIAHLKSVKHQQRYISIHMPEKDSVLLKFPGPDRTAAFTKLFRSIEDKFPKRLRPWGARYDLTEKIQGQHGKTLEEYMKQKIEKGDHYRLSFVSGKEIPIIKKGLPEIPPPETAKAKKSKGHPSTSSECSFRTRSVLPSELPMKDKVRQWLDKTEPSPTLNRWMYQFRELVDLANIDGAPHNYPEGHKCVTTFEEEISALLINERDLIRYIFTILCQVDSCHILDEDTGEIDEGKFEACIELCIRCAEAKPVAMSFCIPICVNYFASIIELVNRNLGSQSMSEWLKDMCCMTLTQLSLYKFFERCYPTAE